jgi:hypothetical protein
MPSPPCDRSGVRSPCVNTSNTYGSSEPSIPSPESVTFSTASSSACCQASSIVPCGRVYLAALSSRLLTTWIRRSSSPKTHTGWPGGSNLKSCPRSSNMGRTVSTAQRAISPSSTVRRRMMMAPRVMRATSSRVVDQARQVTRLPVHHRHQLQQRVVGERMPTQDRQRAADGRERIAQFVRQHRQELVLAAIGVAQGCFRALALGDIENHAEHRLFAVEPNRRAVQLDVDRHAAVGAVSSRPGARSATPRCASAPSTTAGTRVRPD